MAKTIQAFDLLKAVVHHLSQISWKGAHHQYDYSGFENALWVFSRSRLFGEGELLWCDLYPWRSCLICVPFLRLKVFCPCNVNDLSSQLRGSSRVDRVDIKDDHVLLYLTEVRWKPLISLKYNGLHLKIIYFAVSVSKAEIQKLLLRSFNDPYVCFSQQLTSLFPFHITLDIIQEFPVQNLKPAVVKIYDYYQPSKLIY